jgi:hypothetical protein
MPEYILKLIATNFIGIDSGVHAGFADSCQLYNYERTE